MKLDWSIRVQGAAVLAVRDAARPPRAVSPIGEDYRKMNESSLARCFASGGRAWLSTLFLLFTGCAGDDGYGEETASQQHALVSPVTISFRQGSLPSSSYVGASDATLRQASPTANSGSTTSCEIDGDDGNGADLSCALRWDVSAIPPGSTVQSVSLTFRVVDSSSNVYDIHALKRSWIESQISWDQATASTSWSTPGAMGSNDRGVHIGTLTGSTGTRSAVLNANAVSAVQGWVDGQTNAGIIISHPTHTNGLDVATAQHGTSSYRPTLTVTYLPPESGGGDEQIPTQQNLLVAFIGDQGNGSNATQVLNLIKNEGAVATVHNGDFDYQDNPSAWENRINNVLGANYPYFAVVGNHDAAAWAGSTGYASYINARVERVPDMECTGENGVRANCFFRGLHLVQSCIGTGELRSSCGKDSADQIGFLQSSLVSDGHLWSVCSWHKNQRSMQVGTKSDEVGWQAYQACAQAGAIISTGHEHSYSRTLTLTNLGNIAAGHGATGAHDVVQLGAGKTFVFVSGLAGVGMRPFSTTHHANDTWWSSYYTSDRWLRHGVLQSGSGNYGALFVRFYVDGNPKKATAYFKDVSGRIVDTFTMLLD